MRATDHRYRGEKAKFDLAIRMIGHEARTGTIRFWTGLSDDRIRKLYTSYFKYGDAPVRRRRGRSPTQVAPLIKTPLRALESGVFVNLLIANGLLSLEPSLEPRLKGNVDLGHRFCECYETYCALVPRANLSFEWGWNLLASLRRGTSSASRAAIRARSVMSSICSRCLGRSAPPARRSRMRSAAAAKRSRATRGQSPSSPDLARRAEVAGRARPLSRMSGTRQNGVVRTKRRTPRQSLPGRTATAVTCRRRGDTRCA
jgi:hypothetical protein